jgi:hypothetical protein
LTHVEKKWKANLEKVAFAKDFPGRVHRWEEAVGLSVRALVQVTGKPITLLVFEGGRFAFVSPSDPQPPELLAGLAAARPELERYHPDAYRSLDRLAAEDREMGRVARLENILGAIRNNLPQMPELKERLRRLLDEIEKENSK